MDAIAAVSDPRSEFYDLWRRENLPGQRDDGPPHGDRGARRARPARAPRATGTASAASGGSATSPATELGREEWAYFESRGEKRTQKFNARGT